MLGGYCMSTTLTNGLKLPDKGSVDWYADMQSNYTILDGAVGTIAEHTSALSGKAPLVHTHTKSDITDFPALANVATSGSYNDLNNIPASFTPSSHTHGNLTNDGKIGTTANVPLITGTGGVVQAGSFGNAANTFCEGNDSRLSDARTPVAHTHTKSDVTDLLNSNFIPSANNSYDLGSSSYQWNNLYAKNYYYNGVEFQNKFVTLDTGQTITGTKTFSSNILSKNYNYSRGTVPSTSQYNTYAFRDNSNNTTARLLRWFNTDGYNGLTLQSWDAQLTTDTSIFFQLQYDYSGNGQATIGGNNFKEFDPLTNNSIDLGTSSRKWKTLNGINPGALSLPDLSVYKEIDRTGWVYNGTTLNSVLLNAGDTNITSNGWLYVRTNGTTSGDRIGIRLNRDAAEYPTTIVGEIGFGHIEAFVPVVAGYAAYIFTNKSPTYVRFYPCLGNVPSGV